MVTAGRTRDAWINSLAWHPYAVLQPLPTEGFLEPPAPLPTDILSSHPSVWTLGTRTHPVLPPPLSSPLPPLPGPQPLSGGLQGVRREEGTGKGKEGEWKRERLSLLTEAEQGGNAGRPAGAWGTGLPGGG